MFSSLVLLIFMMTHGHGDADNFPSLITTNATLAIVIDREYLADQYEPIKAAIETYLVYAKREILKHGGVNIQFFSWTNINLKRDITAIFSIAPCKDTWNLFQAASEENILHVAISETDCPRMPTDEAFTVPLITLGEELPQIFLDLRTTEVFKWNSVIVLYDLSLERDMVTRVVTSLTKESIALKKNSAVSLIKLNTNSSVTINRQQIAESLSKINPKMLGRNFLCIVSFDTMEIILDLAKEYELVSPISQWLYVISDSSSNNNKSNITNAKKFLKEGDNISFIYNSTIWNSNCKVGLSCHTEEILEAFIRSLEISILGEYELASQVSDEEWEAIRPTKLERRKSLLYNIKNHLLQFGTCDNCTTWKFEAGETWGREFSNVELGNEIINVGTWRPSDGNTMVDELFLHVAHGFRGRTLPLVTFHNPPWQILKLNETGVVEYGGLVFDIIKEIAANLNFTYTVEALKVPMKINTGNKTFNNQNGIDVSDVVTYKIPDNIINAVRSKKAAIGAAAFTISNHGKAFINFTRPISTQAYSFLVARPKELSRALLFISPFTKDTWLCLAVAIVSMGPILYYIHRFSPVYQYKGISMKGGLSSIENCIWYMYGALLQQGGMHLPYADSARIIVGSWWLVVLVVSTTYCGNLVAFLTFPKLAIPITTLSSLLSHSDTITWSVSSGTYIEYQLNTATEPIYKDLLKGSIKMGLESKKMLPLVEQGKHVYIDWKIRLQYVMRQQYLVTGRCDLALGTDEYFDENIAMIVAQDTPYLPKINEEIKRLHQNGLIDKWLKDYLPKRDKCFKIRHISEVNNHTVNMDDMQGSFFVLFFGFIFAALLILIEKVWHKYKLKKNKKIIQPYAT